MRITLLLAVLIMTSDGCADLQLTGLLPNKFDLYPSSVYTEGGSDTPASGDFSEITTTNAFHILGSTTNIFTIYDDGVVLPTANPSSGTFSGDPADYQVGTMNFAYIAPLWIAPNSANFTYEYEYKVILKSEQYLNRIAVGAYLCVFGRIEEDLKPVNKGADVLEIILITWKISDTVTGYIEYYAQLALANTVDGKTYSVMYYDSYPTETPFTALLDTGAIIGTVNGFYSNSLQARFAVICPNSGEGVTFGQRILEGSNSLCGKPGRYVFYLSDITTASIDICETLDPDFHQRSSNRREPIIPIPTCNVRGYCNFTNFDDQSNSDVKFDYIFLKEATKFGGFELVDPDTGVRPAPQCVFVDITEKDDFWHVRKTWTQQELADCKVKSFVSYITTTLDRLNLYVKIQCTGLQQRAVLSNFVANIVAYVSSTVLDISFHFRSITPSDISFETSFQDVSNVLSHDRNRKEWNEENLCKLLFRQRSLIIQYPHS